MIDNNNINFSKIKKFSKKTNKIPITTYLTPIPIQESKSIIKNKVLNRQISDAERTAVFIRRNEYSKSMKNKQKSENISIENLQKIYLLQEWWKTMFKIILIQKNIRGFLYRKKLMIILESQEKFIDKLILTENIQKKIWLRRIRSKIYSYIRRALFVCLLYQNDNRLKFKKFRKWNEKIKKELLNEKLEQFHLTESNKEINLSINLNSEENNNNNNKIFNIDSLNDEFSEIIDLKNYNFNIKKFGIIIENINNKNIQKYYFNIWKMKTELIKFKKLQNLNELKNLNIIFSKKSFCYYLKKYCENYNNYNNNNNNKLNILFRYLIIWNYKIYGNLIIFNNFKNLLFQNKLKIGINILFNILIKKFLTCKINKNYEIKFPLFINKIKEYLKKIYFIELFNNLNEIKIINSKVTKIKVIRSKNKNKKIKKYFKHWRNITFLNLIIKKIISKKNYKNNNINFNFDNNIINKSNFFSNEFSISNIEILNEENITNNNINLISLTQSSDKKNNNLNNNNNNSI